MTEVRVPDDWWSIEMEGVLTTWHVDSGAQVKAGDVVAEVSVEKAQMEIEVEVDGVLNHKVNEGDLLRSGHLIATID